VLRLFNDCVAMFLLYVALSFFVRQRWTIGCLFFSLGVSVKMNVLLFVPSLGLLMVKSLGWVRTIPKILLCVIVQVILAVPFLETNPYSYFNRSFEFGRQFFFKWSVNWQFLPEPIFLSKQWAIFLLCCHFSGLLLFALKRWCNQENGLFAVILEKHLKRSSDYRLSSDHIALVMFTGNFIGVVFARSLHYQFYVWYFHSLPFLLWHTPYRIVTRLLLLGLIEFVWNSYPPASSTARILLCCHLAILLGLWFAPEIPAGTKLKHT